MAQCNLLERKSPRLPGWDYETPGWYFVTICTKDRAHFFGEIQHQMIGLSVPGCIAWYVWNLIPVQFDSVTIDAFIVMPNHIHGIIKIENTAGKSRKTINHIPADNEKDVGGITGLQNPMLTTRGLGRIIQWFKGRCTREIRKRGQYDFAWQSRYHDHIVRDANELDRIRRYISNNPIQWKEDKYHEQNSIK